MEGQQRKQNYNEKWNEKQIWLTMCCERARFFLRYMPEIVCLWAVVSLRRNGSVIRDHFM